MNFDLPRPPISKQHSNNKKIPSQKVGTAINFFVFTFFPFSEESFMQKWTMMSELNCLICYLINISIVDLPKHN